MNVQDAIKPYGSGTYLVTAALIYANGKIHIGHVGGPCLPADVFVRYLRMRGHRVLFVCGSDEYGVAILLQAHKEGKTPQAVIDEYHRRNKSTFERFGISFDIYDRTSRPEHAATAQAFFKKLHEKGVFTTQTKAQYYDAEAKIFLADRYLEGTCPHCQFEGAYGDQCESCGLSLDPGDLLSPRSKLTQTTPIQKSTTHWYLPLERYQSWLEAWIETKRDVWRANAYGQSTSWLKAGLKPRAMTRDLDWGVPVPLDEAKGKVLYVWFEALLGYISATKRWAKENGVDWRDFWQDDNTELIHFIGKDNIVFHTIIFPAMLKAYGDYILPTHVVSSEFMQLEGEKISTSRNHAIWIEDIPTKWIEPYRYFLQSISPDQKDGNFRQEDFVERHNKELVGVLGNFIHRAITLLHRYTAAKIPENHAKHPEDNALRQSIAQLNQQICTELEGFKIKQALHHVMEIAHLGNQYLATTEPWHLIKTDLPRTRTILYHAAQLVAHLQRALTPFLPTTAARIGKMIQHIATKWSDDDNFDLLKTGRAVEKPVLLFEKIEKNTLGD
ncbi:MAG: methionine--tRNA ligase [Cytophagales bacterium]